ncbi:polypeptide N-acetylgalactosaminyltransferase 15 isoform X3 [Caretta caretta]|uniref:polypeptide N-acetylgalactosaminyltransferase 15 isoform X3 n=1 Tax=Caretta caretta TaxID=8467 RepID=UPI0020940658|nr:polypeptide N-acetylgalactosaminyltransferase 15 isoform X3 [Caretta caretta]
MLLKKRCRYGSRKLQFLLLLLMLGFLLLMVTILNPPFRDLNKAGTSQPLKFSAREGYQLDFPETQEMLETQEESQQYYPMVGLAPFISLREDELLVAIVSPIARRNDSKARKGYRMVKQQSKRQEEKTNVKPRGNQESQLMSFPLQDSEEAAGGEQLAILGLETHGFNEALSERISLRRELPEVRHPFCLQQDYDPNLPTASVIICFHDEAWSTLLRTVHSVMDTAPRASLKEIILVDDLSQQGHLKSALSEYISKLDGVKLIRSNKRLGVIQGRMLGAARATGDVLVFMDSHCECHTGWLEPLLGRLATDRNRIVSPVIDVIDWKTFQYHQSVDLQRGGFDWKLDFHWEPLPEHEEKAWLCGGSVEILPCSRVGHIFRNHIPHTFPNEEAAVRNKIRIAETWLDSFKEIFYEHDTVAFLISKAEKPDCNERLQLQKRLGCRKFHWFISNVYPELYPPVYKPRFSGKLYNTGVGFCADYRSAWGAAEGPIELSPCSDNINQHFEYNSMKEIRFGSALQFCFDVRHEKVILQNCTQEAENNQQQWDVQESGMIVHILSGKCLEAVKIEAEKDLSLRVCNKNENQLWRFDHSHVLDER